ncbi:hypothetical protein ANO14919_130890 [Xylariales sp. No.14919]|nr:hypothetical protein ANO14919_130890 [Xylariales sp. No.14919]
MAGPVQPCYGKFYVLLAQDLAVWLIGSSGQDEVAQESNGDSDDGTDDIHPSPTSQAMNTFQCC